MNVPLLDLSAQHRPFFKEMESAISSVIEDGHYILGENVERFEQEMCAYTGARHAIGVASGTDALLLSLKSQGVGPGDEVITTPFTFIATADSICAAGANPVFADINPLTYNLDPEAVEHAITPRTRAIIPVHLYGMPADMDGITRLARPHGLTIIEDNAQALGAEYEGRKTGSIGKAAALSFFPSKNMGCCGDGGMVLTSDDAVAARVRRLRVHGNERKYYAMELGINSRLDELQAAILRLKLPHLDDWNHARNRNAGIYDSMLAESDRITTPIRIPGRTHVFHQYTISVLERDRVQAHLRERGIGNAIYYPTPLHLQPAFSYLGLKKGSFPHAEAAAARVLSLPIGPELSERDVECVAENVIEVMS